MEHAPGAVVATISSTSGEKSGEPELNIDLCDLLDLCIQRSVEGIFGVSGAGHRSTTNLPSKNEMFPGVSGATKPIPQKKMGAGKGKPGAGAEMTIPTTGGTSKTGKPSAPASGTPTGADALKQVQTDPEKARKDAEAQLNGNSKNNPTGALPDDLKKLLGQ